MLALESFSPSPLPSFQTKGKNWKEYDEKHQKILSGRERSSLETFQKLYLLELIIDSGNFYVDFLLSQRREGIHFGL